MESVTNGREDIREQAAQLLQQVEKLASEGYTQKEIANQLGFKTTFTLNNRLVRASQITGHAVPPFRPNRRSSKVFTRVVQATGRVLFFNEDAYWEAVRGTLESVFQADPQLADRLRERMSSRTPEQRLLFYHTEPFRVAADLSGTEIEELHIKRYRELIEAGQLVGQGASSGER